jgi:hypothetical protein
MICKVTIYLSTVASGGLMWAQQRRLESHKTWRVYWVAEKLLASQQGFFSIYLVSYVSSYVAKVLVLLWCYRTLIGSYRRFDRAYRLHLQGSKSPTLTTTILQNVTSVLSVHSKCMPQNMHEHTTGDPAYFTLLIYYMSRVWPLRKPHKALRNTDMKGV